MARTNRVRHDYAFASDADFNEQLYEALRQSPWWMTSVAIHVLIFFVLTLFDTSDATPAVKHTVKINSGDIIEPDDPPEDEPTKPVDVTDDTVVPDPMIVPDPEHTEPEDDNDMDFNEPLGKTDGLSNAPWDGPSTNGDIGIGGGLGSSRPGRGGDGSGGGGGGTPREFEQALEDALRWLAAHQSPNGGWEADGFYRWCDGRPVTDRAKQPDGRGKQLYDAGVTGLALCAFLGAGYTNRGNHPFNKVVGRGLRFLKNIQDPEGCFGPRASQQYIYNHATAALAMVEAYGMTGSSIWRGSAQRALDFIALTRNPYMAWRYGIKPGDNDTSVTGWMMMALKSAQLINKDVAKRGKRGRGLVIDESAFDGIRTWLDKVTDPDYGQVGYITRGVGPARPLDLVDRFPADKSASMTAVGVLARIFLGEDPRKSRLVQKGADIMAKLPPTWNKADGSIDMYYWYYATLAMFQVGDRPWKVWRQAMQKSMVETQRKDTDYCQYKGSWDPVGPWGLDGGRVYSTAVMAMCLEIYYRYPKVFGTR